MSNAGRVQAGSVRTHAGLSHSWERPTSVSPAPRAQTISVPLANRDTTRMTQLAATDRVRLSRRDVNEASSTAKPPNSATAKPASPSTLLRKKGIAAA